MSQIPYETIKPLIVGAEQRGSSMHVTFRCPVTGETVDASGHLRKSDSVANRAVSSAKRSLWNSLRWGISRAVRQAVGYNIAGRVASDAAYGAMGGMGRSESFSESDERDAIARAFESVSSRFVWDARQNCYISAKAAGQVMTDFMQLLNTAPVTGPYDRGVLARMLTEVACADGQVGDEERQFLSSFITPDIGTVDSLAEMDRLSPAELSETTPGQARETMLMLAWALALTDQNLSSEEAVRLGEYAQGLALSSERAHELRLYAQTYLLDQALATAYPGGHRDQAAHAEVMAMAARLGLDATEAERIDIRFRKRHGLV